MTTPNNATARPERELAEKLSRGSDVDNRIAASLVDTYYPVLLRYAHEVGIPEGDIDDVIQDTFVDAYRYLQHHAAVETFRTALLNAFRRRVTERFNRNIDHVVADDVAETLESPSLGILDVAILREAFEKVLTDDESRVLLLRYVEGQSTDEIARALGASPQAIHRRISGAAKKLQDFLTERSGSRK